MELVAKTGPRHRRPCALPRPEEEGAQRPAAISARRATSSMGISDLFTGDTWVIEDHSHDGIRIDRLTNGRYVVSAWAENWDDEWTWVAEITRDELAGVVADPDFARELLGTARRWRVEPPETVPREPYVKDGQLDQRDGFVDGGRGGKA